MECLGIQNDINLVFDVTFVMQTKCVGPRCRLIHPGQDIIAIFIQTLHILRFVIVQRAASPFIRLLLIRIIIVLAKKCLSKHTMKQNQEI